MAREVAGVGDAERLHHAPARRRLDGRDQSGRFRSMQLQPVGLQRLDERASPAASSQSTIRATISAFPRAMAASSTARSIATKRGLFGWKFEADHVRAGIERGAQRLGRREPADLDRESFVQVGHRAALARRRCLAHLQDCGRRAAAAAMACAGAHKPGFAPARMVRRRCQVGTQAAVQRVSRDLRRGSWLPKRPPAFMCSAANSRFPCSRLRRPGLTPPACGLEQGP